MNGYLRDTYYVKVTSGDGMATGMYAVSVNYDVDIDGNGTPTAGNAWHLGSGAGSLAALAADRFNTGTDVDWYSFEVTAESSWVVIETWAATSSAPATIEVYAPDRLYQRDLPDSDPSAPDLGHWFLRDQGGGLSNDGASARLAFSAPMTGTYYAKVARPPGVTALLPYRVVFYSANYVFPPPAYP